MALHLERLNIVDEDRRIFEGLLSPEMRDNASVVVPTREVKRFMDRFLSRGGTLSEEHTNRHVGRVLEYWDTEIEVTEELAKQAIEANPKNPTVAATVKQYVGKTIPALGVRAQIFKDYPYEDEVWARIKDQSRPDSIKGLSFGGRSAPVAYDEEHKGIVHNLMAMWEVAITTAPRVALGLLTGVNEIAQSEVNTMSDEERSKSEDADTLKNRKEEEQSVTEEETSTKEFEQTELVSEDKSESRSESPQAASIDALAAELAGMKNRMARLEELLSQSPAVPSEQPPVVSEEAQGEEAPGADAQVAESEQADSRAEDDKPEEAPEKGPDEEKAPEKSDSAEEEPAKEKKDEEVAQSDARKTRKIHSEARPDYEIQQSLTAGARAYNPVDIAMGRVNPSYSQLRGLKQ